MHHCPYICMKEKRKQRGRRREAEAGEKQETDMFKRHSQGRQSIKRLPSSASFSSFVVVVVFFFYASSSEAGRSILLLFLVLMFLLLSQLFLLLLYCLCLCHILSCYLYSDTSLTSIESAAFFSS